jgi:hypothetical protein
MRIVARSWVGKRSAKATRGPITPHALLGLGILAALVLGFAGASHAQIPTIDIQQTCKAAASAMLMMRDSSTSRNDFDQCMRAEQEARTQIGKDWATYSAADRTQCLNTGVYLPSYIEWLTCLEMERDARKYRGNEPSPALGLTTTTTLPIVKPGINDARPARGPVEWTTLPVVRPGINDAPPARGPRTYVTLPIVKPGVLY